MYLKIAVMLLVIMFISACNVFTEDKNIEHTYTNPSYENMSNNNNGQFRAPKVKQMAGEKDVAKDLVQLAGQVQGVNGATAIVSGMYSVVGITFDNNLSNQEKAQVKKNVYKALIKHPRGANTAIATKPADVQKIKGMRERLNNTKLASGVYEDLGRLIGTLEPNETNPTDTSYPSEEDIRHSNIKKEFSR